MAVPKSRLDETLRKVVQQIDPSERSRISSNQEITNDPFGDPDCPICEGAGYLRSDFPIGHPQFGKIVACECRHKSITDQVRGRLYSLSNLDELSNLTFETFLPRGSKGLGHVHAQSINVAFNQAKIFASSLSGWLFLHGPYGCGKTHLAAAIANFAVQMGIPTLFLTVPDLLDSLRFAYDGNDTTFEQRFNQIKTVELLVLDDFGTQNATAWAQEKLFQIINYRYINHIPMVITSNLAMEEIEPRIRSRLQDPSMVSLVKINAPDYRRPTDEMGHSDISSLDVLSKRTFANFSNRSDEKLTREERKSLEEALNAAMDFSKNPVGWLVFIGDYGSGKTHLAAAIANDRAQMGDPPLVVLVPDLLDHLRSTFSPNSSISYDRMFDEVKVAPLLILDDLGSQSSTPWAKEKLFQLLNYRYNLELPTVITIASGTLEKVEERIHTRLVDDRLCHLITLLIPTYAGAVPRIDRTRKKNARSNA